jgi:HD-GYP domain-containing protein (c-di-GMP phosphodiesterase class II)
MSIEQRNRHDRIVGGMTLATLRAVHFMLFPALSDRTDKQTNMFSKVDSPNIKVGMFVAELDRPWLDTPFLLQGFIVEHERQIVRLQEYCRYVMIDTTRSAAGLFAEAVRKQRVNTGGGPVPGPDGVGRIFTSESTAVDISATGRFRIETRPMQDTGRTNAARAADSVNTAPAADRAKKGIIASLLAGLAGLFSGICGWRLWRREASASRPEYFEFIPPGIELAHHAENKTIEEELGTAQGAYESIDKFSHQMLRDLQSGKPPAVHDLAEVVHEVVDSMVRNPDAFMWVARLKRQDTNVYGHTLQVAVYIVALGRHLGLPRAYLARLGLLGLLLDIGKTKLPRTLLAKRGALTDEEFALVKRHVEFGLELLRKTPGLDADLLDGIAEHHERENGSGYPAGLEARQISLFGRMAGICDAFVAITNARSYADAVAPYDAMRMLSSWSGNFFHVPLVEQFMQAVGVFPVGSLVELSSGEVAVVVRQSRVRRLKPRVLVVLDSKKERYAEPRFLDLLEEEAKSAGQPVYIGKGLPSGAYGLDSGELYLS